MTPPGMATRGPGDPHRTGRPGRGEGQHTGETGPLRRLLEPQGRRRAERPAREVGEAARPCRSPPCPGPRWCGRPRSASGTAGRWPAPGRGCGGPAPPAARRCTGSPPGRRDGPGPPWRCRGRTGTRSPSKPYFVSRSRVSSSTRSISSGSSTRSNLLRNTTSSGTPTCRASRMCSRVCGIGPSAAESSRIGAVHLGRPGDHVLDVIGMAGAVDVGVVPALRLVLDVAGDDRDGLGRVAHRAALGDVLVVLGRARPLVAWTARMAAVRVVLPWSMWPMVPTLT